MLSVQLGGALSVGLFDQLGPAGTAWLRLCVAAAVLLAVVRPRLSRPCPAAAWSPRSSSDGVGAS